MSLKDTKIDELKGLVNTITEQKDDEIKQLKHELAEIKQLKQELAEKTKLIEKIRKMIS